VTKKRDGVLQNRFYNLSNRKKNVLCKGVVTPQKNPEGDGEGTNEKGSRKGSETAVDGVGKKNLLATRCRREGGDMKKSAPKEGKCGGGGGRPPDQREQL